MLAASLHYFRTPPRSFARALAALRSSGFDTVESPVPWCEHERAGDFEFSSDGAQLIAFVEEAARAALGVHLRLGPCVGSGVTHFGLPSDIAEDASIAARLPAGGPQVVPVPPRWTLAPSYASRAYGERAAAWIRSVCTALRPYSGPGGPVRSIAVGDARPFLGRAAAVPGDRHPDAVAAFEVFRAAADPAERDRLLPPVRLESFDRASSAAAVGAALFAERVYLDWLETLAAAAAESLDIPIATSVPSSGLFAPVGAGMLACRFERLGFDAYGWKDVPRPLERDLRLAAGTARHPFASHVATGTPPHLPHLGPEDNLAGLRACLATGVRGIVVSAGIARDRWIGGVLDEPLREFTDVSVPVRRLLSGVSRSGWLRLGRPARAAIVLPRSLVRAAMAASSAWLGPIGPDLLGAAGQPPPSAADPRDAGLAGGAWWRWLEAAERALDRAGVPYVIADDEGPLDPDPRETPLLLVPTADEIAPATLRRIRRHAEAGGIVVLGPAAPTRDLITGESVPALPSGIVVAESPESDAAAAAIRGAARVEPDADGDVVVERVLLRERAEPGPVGGLVATNRSRRTLPVARVAGEGRWRDLDEPGTAAAKGTVEPGATRLLVPADSRKGAE